jgi:ATP-dependent Clp protease protease subunit
MVKDFYLYDEISNASDMWSDGIGASDLVEATTDMHSGDELNIYVNSPGGSVFEATAMTAQINRLRQNGITVNAYIDGIAASAASFLVMACDNIYAYETSMLMIHKPMCLAYGNADDMLKQAEMLEQVESSTCMPLYTSRAKVDESQLKDMMSAETWMDADQMAETFDIEKIDQPKKVDNVNPEMLKMYKNVPEHLVKAETTAATPQTEPAEPVDLDTYKRRYATA